LSRATISDVARAAGVGVATVDRVLNQRAPVRRETAQKVLAAAEALGYHATGILRRRLEEDAPPPRLGFLLQRRDDNFYIALAAALAEAARAAGARPVIQHMDDITPAIVAERFASLGERVDALALVAADHPQIAGMVEAASARLPIFTLLSDLSAPGRRGFIGIDQRKAGRTAAWAIARLSRCTEGRIGIFVGSHRYLGHELAEISFRSWFRENAPGFDLLEPLVSLEDKRIAYEATLHLLERHSDIAGLYAAGGGKEGVIAALRDHGGHGDIVTVCSELIPETRAALIDGVIDMTLATPVARLATTTVSEMINATRMRQAAPAIHLLPFEIYVAENI
jgi:LacI family transcriptional regulator